VSARRAVGDWAAALFLVALVYVLVRPQSAAADMVTQFSKAMAALVRTVTDL
jgi:hypothetical protein